MPSCYTYGFSNRSNTLSESSFHGLPNKSKCPSIRKRWLANIKRGGELPKEEHFVISSHHFDKGCIEVDLKVLFIVMQPDKGVLVILVVH